MGDPEHDGSEFNRRDFLKGGSLATLMTLLGGRGLPRRSEAAAGEGCPEMLT